MRQPSTTARFKTSTTLLGSLLIALLGSLALAGAATDPLERGRELTRLFYDGDLAPIAAALSPEMTEAVGGEEGLRLFREQVRSQLGDETSVLDETVTEHPGASVYRRTARFSAFGGPVVVDWALDGSGTVIGFYIGADQPTEAAESRFLDYETRTPLRLPFTGEWAVGWGGRTVAENYHAAYPDQRFAYDFLVIRDGSSHEGAGRENSDYYCFGRPILAPGAGVIVAAQDGAPDNTPGEFTDDAPLGNHVIIDHGEGEHSFLAHLQEGSVSVEVGQTVAAGAVIGACGNSGRSSEPHLHYHLQNTPEFGNGEGLPAQFQGYLADGELVERGEPVQWQLVRPADARDD